MSLKIEHQKIGKVLTINILNHKLDDDVGHEFKKEILRFIKNGEKKIVLNLALVNFINSSGLGAIVTASKALGKNGEIIISNVRLTVKAIFELTHLQKLFQFTNSVEEAVQLLK